MRYAITLFLFLSGCGSDSSTSSAPAPKTLASKWSSPGDPAWSLDFTKASVGPTFTIYESYLSGGSCQSSAVVSSLADYSSKDEGVLHISGSVAVNNISGMASCSQFDGDWNYSVLADGSLAVCKATNCIWVVLN